MARIYAPFVRQASTTTGTGAYTVAGTVTGHVAFSARCATGDVFRYVARAVDGSGNPTGAYEVGTGTYSSANTITRTAVLYSSNADAAVNWSAGTRHIDIISWVDAILGQSVDSLDPVVVTATKPAPVDADKLIMLNSAATDAPVLVTKAQLLSAVSAAIVSLGDRVTALEGAPVVPSAFTAGQWTVAATGTSGEISINLTALPSNGGAAISALQYRVGTGSAVTLSGTGTGARTVTGLTDGVAVDIQVRAVNSVGNGTWSDTKSVTPSAAATAPAAFTAGQWTLTAGDTLLVANITALPSNGGSAITALQYRLGGGTAVAFTGTGTGSRNITGLTNATSYNVEIRAVNSVGNGPWSDLKSATPAVPSGNVVATLLAGSPFAFAVVPGDSTITRCYTETTGASATTLCANGDQIGTIECVPLGTFITYPTGTRPVFNTSAGDSWITMASDVAMFHQSGSAYTGSDEMLFAGAIQSPAGGGTGNPVLAAANNGTNAFWGSSQRGGLQNNGLVIDSVRSGATASPLPDFGLAATQKLAFHYQFASTSINGWGQRTAGGGGTNPSTVSNTFSSVGAWNVNRAYLGSVAGESTFTGPIYALMVIRATADAGQLAALKTYLADLVDLTV